MPLGVDHNFGIATAKSLKELKLPLMPLGVDRLNVRSNNQPKLKSPQMPLGVSPQNLTDIPWKHQTITTQ